MNIEIEIEPSHSCECKENFKYKKIHNKIMCSLMDIYLLVFVSYK